MNKDDARVELLPCPFCGGDAEIYLREYTDAEADFGNSAVDCGRCGAGFGLKKTETDAIAAWNTRHQSTTDLRAKADAFIKIAEDVDAVANGGADTISFLVQLNRIAKSARAALAAYRGGAS